jgi:hypothetical protein
MIESEDNLNGAEIAVRDMTGRLLLSEIVNNNTLDIPSTWSTGIYLVQIRSNENIHAQKIIVR